MRRIVLLLRKVSTEEMGEAVAVRACNNQKRSCLSFLDHNLCGFDDGADRVADFQFHFLSTGAGNDRFDFVFANSNNDVGHDVAQFDFRDFADEAVAG